MPTNERVQELVKERELANYRNCFKLAAPLYRNCKKCNNAVRAYCIAINC